MNIIDDAVAFFESGEAQKALALVQAASALAPEFKKLMDLLTSGHPLAQERVGDVLREPSESEKAEADIKKLGG